MPLVIKLKSTQASLLLKNGEASRSALAMRKYRAKIKANPELYEAKKEEEKNRSRERRRNATKEQKERARETARNRMRMKRERNKESYTNNEAGAKNSMVVTRQTEEKMEKLREYNRVQKQKSRKRMSAQKKRREREKNAARNAEKRRQKIKQRVENKQRVETERVSQGYSSVNARTKAASRIRKHLPQDSTKYAEVINHLTNHATPRKKQALDKIQGQTSAKKQLKNMFQCFRDVKSAVGKKHTASLPRRNFLKQVVSRLRAKYKMKAKDVSRGLGISWFETKQFSQDGAEDGRKSRKDKLSNSMIQSVINFLQRPDNSVELPNKKSVDRALQPSRVAQRSLQNLYKKWKEENPTSIMGFTKFAHIRKTETKVKTQKHRAMIQCLCEYCTNVELKMKAIAPKKFLGDKYDIANKTLCNYTTFPNLSCIDRSCSKCGPDMVIKELEPFFESEVPLTWFVWEYKESTLTKGKKRALMRKSTSMKELVYELIKDLTPFTSHLFHAQWQHNQFKIITNNIPVNTVVMVMDFAENYSCFYQQEIQSAHWAKNVVTVHPMVVYYNCPEHDVIVREYLDFLSPDNVHDAAAVAEFVKIAISHLRKRDLSIDRVIQFTDGASSQYKSRTPFCDLSYSQEDHGVIMERHFFGSRHGKGPCDGEGAVVKCAVARAVKNGQAIVNDAKSFFEFCEMNLTKKIHDSFGRICKQDSTFSRTFFFLDNIEHNRPGREGSTVLGTRKLHSVCGGREGLGPGKLAVRRLSCFCGSCESHGGSCENKEYVKSWKVVTLKIDPDESSHATTSGADFQSSPAPASPTLSTNDEKSWKIGDWVLVSYDNEVYPGQVTNIVNRNTEVDCLMRSGSGWIWPEHRDLCWYTEKKIEKQIQPPLPINSRGLLKFIEF